MDAQKGKAVAELKERTDSKPGKFKEHWMMEGTLLPALIPQRLPVLCRRWQPVPYAITIIPTVTVLEEDQLGSGPSGKEEEVGYTCRGTPLKQKKKGTVLDLLV